MKINFDVILERFTEYPKSHKKAPLGFEPRISCLLDRRFNQLSHGAKTTETSFWYVLQEYMIHSSAYNVCCAV